MIAQLLETAPRFSRAPRLNNGSEGVQIHLYHAVVFQIIAARRCRRLAQWGSDVRENAKHLGITMPEPLAVQCVEKGNEGVFHGDVT